MKFYKCTIAGGLFFAYFGSFQTIYRIKTMTVFSGIRTRWPLDRLNYEWSEIDANSGKNKKLKQSKISFV